MRCSKNEYYFIKSLSENLLKSYVNFLESKNDENNENSKTLQIGDIEPTENLLHLGDLKGNHFSICLKDILGKNPEKYLSFVKENGFINFFGEQRFGTNEISTDQIGL